MHSFCWAKVKNMFYTYVLKLIDKSTDKVRYYIGYTSDLKQRLNKHLTKSVNTTIESKKIELIYYESCRNKTDAIHRERQLKTGFGRGYLKNRLKNDTRV